MLGLSVCGWLVALVLCVRWSAIVCWCGLREVQGVRWCAAPCASAHAKRYFQVSHVTRHMKQTKIHGRNFSKRKLKPLVCWFGVLFRCFVSLVLVPLFTVVSWCELVFNKVKHVQTLTTSRLIPRFIAQMQCTKKYECTYNYCLGLTRDLDISLHLDGQHQASHASRQLTVRRVLPQ
jgi:hypothetical protein